MDINAPTAPAPGGRWGTLASVSLVVLACLAAYSNTLGVPLLLDDAAAITENPSVRHLSDALLPPPGLPTSGRPLLNASFALNYALGGLSVTGYHALNLLIHIGAALALLGIVRLTLQGPRLSPRFGRDARLLATLAALVWALHPLQTEAVTYVSQRAESLMGLLYLLTLYCFIRGARRPRPGAWFAAAAATCLLGALTKEVIATAPLLVLLYDRTFVSGSFRSALRRRGLYGGLALSWLALAALALVHGKRGVGFDYGVGPVDYALTSLRSLSLYLGLAVWPSPLVFDYGRAVVRHLSDVGPQAAVALVLVLATAAAVVRRPALGFAGASFLLILAPTTSIVPVALQPAAEHRMYLPLAALVVLLVLGLYRLAGRSAAAVLALAALSLGVAAFRRNQVYATPDALWLDTLAKAPSNARAHCAYGYVLADRPGRLADAIEQYEEAVRLDPDYVEARDDLAIALARTLGRGKDALEQFAQALRINPLYVPAHENLGITLAGLPGRLPEAIGEFRTSLYIDPSFAQAHNDLGLALSHQPGNTAQAIAEYREALRLRPDYPEALCNLGIALVATPGGQPEAIRLLEHALKLRPAYAEAHNALGAALASLPGRSTEARAHYEEALRLKPDYPEAHNNLGLLLAAAPGGMAGAEREFEEAVRLNPAYADAHAHLGLALLQQQGRLQEAVAQLEEALRLAPDDPTIHSNLGIALAQTPGRLREAAQQLEEALRLKPDYADARRNLELVRQLMRQDGR